MISEIFYKWNFDSVSLPWISSISSMRITKGARIIYKTHHNEFSTIWVDSPRLGGPDLGLREVSTRD